MLKSAIFNRLLSSALNIKHLNNTGTDAGHELLLTIIV